jgi:tRNA pseudouridine32 synthase/23S rRNA pseudouridine746 synthase
MERGEVMDENGIRISRESPYRSGVRLYYYRGLDAETPIPFEEAVLYRDEHILVADKPHFLPVVPAGRFVQETLLVRLKRKLALDFLVPIHRIDRETAGIVLFSIQPQSRSAYHALFQKREIHKTYEALAPTLPGTTFPITRRSRIEAGEPFFRMQETDGEPNAETHIDVLETLGDVARYQLTPVTGKKHQLRVHLAALGIPILNDPLYPQLIACKDDVFSQPLQLLAKAIVFTDPVTGVPRRFESRRSLSGGRSGAWE